jgi:hypothetical protein
VTCAPLSLHGPGAQRQAVRISSHTARSRVNRSSPAALNHNAYHLCDHGSFSICNAAGMTLHNLRPMTHRPSSRLPALAQSINICPASCFARRLHFCCCCCCCYCCCYCCCQLIQCVRRARRKQPAPPFPCTGTQMATGHSSSPRC